MSQKSKQYSIFDSEDDIDEERIESLVHAAELIKKEKENNNKYANTETDRKPESTNIFTTFLKDTGREIPQYKKYDAQGKIVDIEFNYLFEQKLKKSSLKKLEKNNTYPSKIKFLISDGSGGTWMESFKYETEKDKIQRILSTYGDGRLDSIINNKVNLEPNIDNINRNYNIIIPQNKATSKLKMKLTKYRSKIAPRKVDSEQGYLKFILGNFMQLGCTVAVGLIGALNIYTIHLMIIDYVAGELGMISVLEKTVALLLISVMFALIFVFISIMVGFWSNKSEPQPPIGIIEHFILYNAKKLGINTHNKLRNLNTWLGKKM